MDIQQRHKYDYQVDLDDEGHVAGKVVRMVGSNKRVLEIGAGPGSITRLLKSVKGCAVTAVELDADAIPYLTPHCERVFQRDLNDPAWLEGLARPDGYEAIMATDVLEHLLDPWGTLAALKPLLAPDGHVVISLPHAGHNAVVGALLAGNFRYHKWGLLDRTHIRFFGLQNIADLFIDAGYAIVDVDYVRRPPEATELADLWAKLPGKTRTALEASAHGDVYQVVIKARPQAPGVQGMPRLAPPQGPRPSRRWETFKARLRPWLPAPLRQALMRMLRALRGRS